MKKSAETGHQERTEQTNTRPNRSTDIGAPNRGFQVQDQDTQPQKGCRGRKRLRDARIAGEERVVVEAPSDPLERGRRWFRNVSEQLQDYDIELLSEAAAAVEEMVVPFEDSDDDENDDDYPSELSLQDEINLQENELSIPTTNHDSTNPNNSSNVNQNYQKLVVNPNNIDVSEIMELFDQAKKTWYFEWSDRVPTSTNLHNWYQDVISNLGLNFSDFDALNSQSLEKAFEKQMLYLSTLHKAYMWSLKDQEEPDMEFNFEFNKLYRNLYYMKQSVQSFVKALEVLSPTYDHLHNDELDITRYSPVDPSKCNSFQNLILYVLFRLSENGYRKYGENCYEPVYNDRRQYTFAWKQVVKIKDFIYKVCRKETNFDQWLNLTQGGHNRAEHVTKFLQECNDQQFPQLVKDRHMFAFKDGLYITRVEQEDGTFTDAFYPYDHMDWDHIDPEKVACNYFDMEFYHDDYQGDWYNINTDNFQKVLNYQWSRQKQEEKGITMSDKEVEEICRWLYVFIGRMLYDLGELGERWEVAPFLIGIGGCGKSTILNCIERFFDRADVGYISNNIDRNYGVAALKESFICIAPEIHGDFALDQTEFQKMISGEAVKIREMYKDPKHVPKWKIPIFLVGNSSSNYDDKQGQISRRLVYFFFNIKVRDDNKDPGLDKKLQQETPALLKKCNLAYLDYVNRYKTRDIWNVLPRYFKNMQSRFNNNPLEEFLRLDKVAIGDGLFVPWDIFKQQFINHCNLNNLGQQRINREDCLHVFAKRTEEMNLQEDIQIRDNITKNWPPGSGNPVRGTYILGISFKDVGVHVVQQPDSDDDEQQQEDDIDMGEVEDITTKTL